MVALVRGQNAMLAATRIRITVEVAGSADLSALLVAATGKVRSDTDFVFYNQRTSTGVAWQPQHLDVDLTTLPPSVERVLAVVSLDDCTFGAAGAPVARLFDAAGTELNSFEISGLGDERAVIAWEVYRRAGAWKVRAVGQGYAGGLGQLVTAYGVDVDDAPQPSGPVPTATVTEMTIRPPSVPIDGPPPTVLPAERVYEHVWSIFEDAARSTAAFRSATAFADQRRDTEVSELLGDPGLRNSPQTEAARAAAEQRHADLVARAAADFHRDVAALSRELQDLTGRLQAPMAAWDTAPWQSWRPVDAPQVAIRLGDLHVAEAPGLRIPMVFRLPIRTPLWIDSGDGHRNEAMAVARSVTVRWLAAYPPGRLKVHVADLVGDGAAAKALGPLTQGVVHPPATTPGQLAEMLGRLSERVDLMQMATEANALDTLDGKIDDARQLLILHDFPYGFDDSAIAHLRFLIDAGPSAGVHLLFVADPSDAATLGPLVSSLWRSMLRLSAVADDHIGDPWVGLTWTFTPDGGIGRSTLDSVMTRLADAGR
jgi:stress response protein SCP2